MLTAKTLFALFQGLVSLANTVASYLHDSQLENAGKAIANAAYLQAALTASRKGDEARAVILERLRRDPNWLPDHDPNAR